ncbi:MAG: DUF6141 family protein [Planctomycetota bacterium]|nr:DUF6141 family protein [Planctomycetota bacterium]
MATPRFEERQRFTQPWLWIILAVMIALMTWGFVQQIVLGEPWGSKPAPDLALWILCPLMGIGIPLFFGALRLDTIVTEDELHVRLRPFRWRRIPIRKITSCEARTYRPIREYGGWGIRYGGKRGWAYNVRGNQGVQLEIEDARPLLIGSQKSEALAAAINAPRAL